MSHSTNAGAGRGLAYSFRIAGAGTGRPVLAVSVNERIAYAVVVVGVASGAQQRLADGTDPRWWR